MKTYEQLSQADKNLALQKAVENILEKVVSGQIRFSDTFNNDDLQARIDAALEKAERTRTPWFAHQYVLDTCREAIEGMATCQAEDALYVEEGENYVCLH